MTSVRKNFWTNLSSPCLTEKVTDGMVVNQIFKPTVDDLSALSFGQAQPFLFGSALVVTNNTIMQRISLLNGFCRNALNNNSFIPNAPGSVNYPFLQNVFVMSLTNPGQRGQAGRVYQNATETQNLALNVNGDVGRTIYIVRGMTYLVQFLSPLNTPGITLVQPDQFSLKNLFVYFTTDVIGGNASNSINDGYEPEKFPGLPIVGVGDSAILIVNDRLPSVGLNYQCSMGPFMGGEIVVLEQGMDTDGVVVTTEVLPAPVGKGVNTDIFC